MKTAYLLPAGFSRFVCSAAGFIMCVVFVPPAAAADAPADAAAPAPAAPPPPPSGTSFVFAAPQAGVVLPSASREKMLAVAKTLLERENPEQLAKMKGVDNPFYLKLEAPPEPTVPSSSGNTSTQPPTPVQPVAPPKLTDDDKLKQVAAIFKPTGILQAGSRRVVQSADMHIGQIEVGGFLTVTFPNESSATQIQVIDANSDNCTLKLNSSTLDVDYVSTAGSAPAPHPAAVSASLPPPAPTPAPAPATSTIKP